LTAVHQDYPLLSADQKIPTLSGSVAIAGLLMTRYATVGATDERGSITATPEQVRISKPKYDRSSFESASPVTVTSSRLLAFGDPRMIDRQVFDIVAAEFIHRRYHPGLIHPPWWDSTRVGSLPGL